VKEGKYGRIIFVLMNENRTMKPVKIVIISNNKKQEKQTTITTNK
jgi:hypothetical protein